MATQTIVTGFTGLNGQNVGTFVDVLRYGSALAQVTIGSGGQVLTNLDFRDHRLPIVTRTTLPAKYAEGATRTSADSTTTTAALQVAIYDDWNPISVEFERTTDPAALVSTVVDASAALFPLVFDIEYLGAIVGGASSTDVEYDAADPIGSFSTLLSGFDTTTYGATGMVLTRAGARKLGLATTASDKALQFQNGIQSLWQGPLFTTGRDRHPARHRFGNGDRRPVPCRCVGCERWHDDRTPPGRHRRCAGSRHRHGAVPEPGCDGLCQRH